MPRRGQNGPRPFHRRVAAPPATVVDLSQFPFHNLSADLTSRSRSSSRHEHLNFTYHHQDSSYDRKPITINFPDRGMDQIRTHTPDPPHYRNQSHYSNEAPYHYSTSFPSTTNHHRGSQTARSHISRPHLDLAPEQRARTSHGARQNTRDVHNTQIRPLDGHTPAPPQPPHFGHLSAAHAMVRPSTTPNPPKTAGRTPYTSNSSYERAWRSNSSAESRVEAVGAGPGLLKRQADIVGQLDANLDLMISRYTQSARLLLHTLHTTMDC